MKALTVAITGAFAKPESTTSGSAVARYLSESKGFKGRIVGLDYGVIDPGLNFRKYFDVGYLLPYSTGEDGVILECLKAIHKKEFIDILIPCIDAELLVFSRLVPELQEMGIHCLIPCSEQIMQRNKGSLGNIAVDAGFCRLQNNFLAVPDFFYQFKEEKECYLSIQDSCVEKGAMDEDVGRSMCTLTGFDGGVLAQQLSGFRRLNITGMGDGKGRLHGVVMMKNCTAINKGRRWPEVSAWDCQLLEITELFVKSLRWLGPLGIEVLHDINGHYFLVEINSCFPTWVYLSQGVGQNLSKLLLGLVNGVPLSGFSSSQIRM